MNSINEVAGYNKLAHAKLLDILIADLIDLEKSPHTPSKGLLNRTINMLADYRAILATHQPQGETEYHVVFDGPPGPEAGRFVEVEDANGRSFNAGEWIERPDGYWELVIRPRQPTNSKETLT